MTKILRSPFVSAFLGGLIVAVTFVLLDSGDHKTVTVPVAQAPYAAEPAAQDTSKGLTAHDIYENAAPGVVHVRSEIVQQVQSPFDLFPQTQQGEATGSGFVVDSKGTILTNYHVIEGARSVTVQFEDKKTKPAKVIGFDKNTDIAVLRVDPSGLTLHPLSLGDSSSVRVGDPTLAIGNPFGLDRTLTTGIVSALQREIQAPNGFAIDHVIQTDAAINPGNSGGPLLDALGRVIGINSQIATGGNGSNGNVGIGFAVPINTAKHVLQEIEAHGKVEHSYLGIEGVEVTPDQGLAAKSGVLITKVFPNSPASKAGLQAQQSATDGSGVLVGGDVIQKIDGQTVRSLDDVRAIVSNKDPGDQVTIVVLRGGRPKTFQATLVATPNAAP